MLVTLLGIVTLVSDSQPLNFVFIAVTVLGITSSVTRSPFRYKSAPLCNGFES